MPNKHDKCRSCGASILWSETITGRRMPLDAKPTPDGNIMLGERQHQPPLAHYQTEQAQAKFREAGELLYTSHFATCPHSEKWRKKK